MRNAETVLAIIRERGNRQLPVEDLYRQLFNPDLYLQAYANIYANPGATTPGVNNDTVDGMSKVKIERLIEALRYERYRWTPVRRTYIAKKNGKLRPLGLPSWSDKLLQEVIRLLLEAYYEPQFSQHSHGFRPARGCHTALTEIVHTWKGTKWFVEGDISGCFDALAHTVLLSILKQNIHDNRFVRLIENLLKAGYLENWKYHRSLSGVPQGSIIGPILTNIYLSKLDEFVEKELIPEYTRGNERKINQVYYTLKEKARRSKKQGRLEEAKLLRKQFQQMPSADPHDPTYRRLRYIRYADDLLLGFIGPKSEAEEIKEKLGLFLATTLKLQLSQEKTLITQATQKAAKFLGYEIAVLHCNDYHARTRQRSLNGVIELRLPKRVIEEKCAVYQKSGKPAGRPELTENEDFTIVNDYQAVLRGIYQYYQLAINVSWLGRLKWVMQVSLLKTLAHKHKTSTTKIARQYRTQIKTPHGIRICYEVKVPREGKKPLIARWGGIPLKRTKQAILIDENPPVFKRPRTELVKRLLAEKCELCGSNDRIEVHHIRKLADLKKKGRAEKPAWVIQMAALRRKTLVVCKGCHYDIHAGRVKANPRK
jgi:group II intron reverse transcriptase/maturase